jgi:hypothetical protein
MILVFLGTKPKMKKPGRMYPVRASVLSQKLTRKFGGHSGQTGKSWRDPESRNFRDFWMPVFTGMTVRAPHTFSANF